MSPTRTNRDQPLLLNDDGSYTLKRFGQSRGAYLETDKVQNVRFYETLGFAVIDERGAPDVAS